MRKTLFDAPWLPYVAPMVVFLALTAVEGSLPGTTERSASRWYPLAYSIKVAVVAAVAWACRSTWRDLAPRPGPGGLALAVVLGLGVAAVWVGLDGHYPVFSWMGGKRTGFDPTALPMAERVAFI